VTAAAGVIGVDYILGGINGGNYYAAPSQFITSLRPLQISQAVIAPDARVSGALVTVNSAAVLSSNHVYSFTVTSSVIPDKVLTVTPKSNQVVFSPSSFTLNVGGGLATQNVTYHTTTGQSFQVPVNYVSANFTCNPQAAGKFYVWFELSGADADYYIIPADTQMLFNQVMLTVSEVPPAPSAASHVTLSWFAVMIVCLFFLL